MYIRENLRQTTKKAAAKSHHVSEETTNPRALRNNRNRLRNITVGFRVSAEENKKLNAAVAISGLPKQEYCYRKCLCQDVVVQGNPRVYKGLKEQMEGILAELKTLNSAKEIEPEMLETIKLIATVMGEMQSSSPTR